MSPPRPPTKPTSHRAYNLNRVITAIREHGTATRADLERITALSRATIAALVTHLIDNGTLQELPPTTATSTGPGRPPTRLALTETAGIVIAMTFGHNDLRTAAATLSGHIINEHHTSLPPDNTINTALDTATHQFSTLLHETGHTHHDVHTIVVGLPAPLNHHTGRIADNNILPGWVDRDPATHLHQRLHRPVHPENAVNLAALGETTHGAGTGTNDLIFVKVSTGVGAGLILNGHLYRGTAGYAGELGHIQIEPNGLVCRCGSRGCLETLVSTPHIINTLQPMHPHPLTTDHIIHLLKTNDPAATRVISDAGRTIGRALADICNILNPQKIIIGGELSHPNSPLIHTIHETITRYAQPAITKTLTTTHATLDNRAELLGAITLAIQHTTNPT